MPPWMLKLSAAVVSIVPPQYVVPPHNGPASMKQPLPTYPGVPPQAPDPAALMPFRSAFSAISLPVVPNPIADGCEFGPGMAPLAATTGQAARSAHGSYAVNVVSGTSASAESSGCIRIAAARHTHGAFPSGASRRKA